MSLIRLYIRGISNSYAQKGNYLLILGDEQLNRQLSIVIGAFEAHAIALSLDDTELHSQPLTHSLLKNIAKKFSIQLKHVLINRFSQGVFYAQLICEREGKEHYIEARTSDAIALALRFDAPVFMYKDIFQEFSVAMLEQNEEFDDEIEYASCSLQGLETLLEEALQEEDYEKAVELRDEILRRKINK